MRAQFGSGHRVSSPSALCAIDPHQAVDQLFRTFCHETAGQLCQLHAGDGCFKCSAVHVAGVGVKGQGVLDTVGSTVSAPAEDSGGELSVEELLPLGSCIGGVDP